VTTVRLPGFKTACGLFKPFRSTAVAFHFWHLFAPNIIKK
jgi:hypothetical protein